MIKDKQKMSQKLTKKKSKSMKYVRKKQMRTLSPRIRPILTPTRILRHLIVMGIMGKFQSSKTAESFADIQHHLNTGSIQITETRYNKLASASNFKLFIGAWIKTETNQLRLRSAVNPSSSHLILQSSTTTCDRLEANAWVFLLQVYEKQSSSPGHFIALDYFRTESNYEGKCVKATGNANNCVPECIDAINTKTVAGAFGSSFTTSFDDLPQNFPMVMDTEIQAIKGAVSGFIDFSGPTISKMSAQALVSGGAMTEIDANRIYLGNFIHSYQNHLFSDTPTPDVIFTEKEFYSRFHSIGLKLKNEEKLKLRTATPLFQQDTGHLPKSFCISGSLGYLDPADFISGDQIILKTTIKKSSSFEIILDFILEDVGNQEYKLKLHVKLDGSSSPVEVGLGTHLIVSGSSFFDVSFCFSFIKYQWTASKTNMFLYFSGYYFRRKTTNPRALEASVFLDPSVTFDLPPAAADVFLELLCAGSGSLSECQKVPFYIVDYREFDWGSSHYYSKEVQDLNPANNQFQVVKNCLHSYGPFGSKICLKCKKNYVWREGECKISDSIIPNCEQVQNVKTEVNSQPTEHCQRCQFSPNQWGIAPPSCLNHKDECVGPTYNLYSNLRCDFCLKPAPENCRCNDNQEVEVNTQVTNANYCKCRIADCFRCSNNPCDACKEGYYYFSPEEMCLLKTDLLGFSPRLGIDKGQSERIAAVCSVTDCLDCTEDHTKCVCLTTDFYYFDDSGKKICSGNVPVGYGKQEVNPSTLEVKRCKEGCLGCRDDYTKCWECSSSNPYRKNEYPVSECYGESRIPEGFGKDRGIEGIIKPCSVDGCIGCKDNHQECLRCSLYHIGAYPVTQCYGSIPIGHGIQVSENQLALCSDQGCKQCKTDYRRCEVCLGDFWKNLNLSAENQRVCTKCDQDGEWRHEAERTCNKCHSTCKKCTSSTENSCTECWGSQYTFLDSRCIISAGEDLEIVHQFYDEPTTTAKVIFSHQLANLAEFSTIKATLISSDSTSIIETTQETPRLNSENPKELLIKIVPIVDEINKASLKVIFKDPSSLKSSKDPLIFLKQKEINITPVSYYKPGSQKTITNTAQAAQTATKTIMTVSLVFSVPTALALLKIQQMLDFLLLLNVDHPSNAKSFLQVLSQSVLEGIPNGLRFLTDDSCKVDLDRFIEEDVSCQIFENLGNYIILVLLFLLVKAMFYVISVLTQEKYEKISSFFKTRNQKMGLSFWLEVMEGIQLDIFMTFFLSVMKDDSENSKILKLNFLIGSLSAFLAVVGNIGLFFLTHRAFQATSKNKKIDGFIKQQYGKYKYLIEDFKRKTFFQRFFRPPNNIKDLLISFSLVILHDIPILQIGTIALWLLGMLAVTIFQKPFLQKKDNIIEALKGFIYLGCCAVMMIQSAVQTSWKRKTQYRFVGYPMIAMISILIVYNIGLSIYQTYRSIKSILIKLKGSFCSGKQQKEGRITSSKKNQILAQRPTQQNHLNISEGDSRMINLNNSSLNEPNRSLTFSHLKSNRPGPSMNLSRNPMKKIQKNPQTNKKLKTLNQVSNQPELENDQKLKKESHMRFGNNPKRKKVKVKSGVLKI